MHGTFVQSTYEDKEKEKFRFCSKSPLTSLLGQEKIESKSLTSSDSDYTDIPDSKRQDLFHLDSELGDYSFVGKFIL